jgi:hypothetical protein
MTAEDFYAYCVGMGYKREDAMMALELSDRDIDVATEMVISGNVSEQGHIDTLVELQQQEMSPAQLDSLIAGTLADPDAMAELKAGQGVAMTMGDANFAVTPEMANEYLVRTTQKTLADTPLPLQLQYPIDDGYGMPGQGYPPAGPGYAAPQGYAAGPGYGTGQGYPPGVPGYGPGAGAGAPGYGPGGGQGYAPAPGPGSAFGAGAPGYGPGGGQGYAPGPGAGYAQGQRGGQQAAQRDSEVEALNAAYRGLTAQEQADVQRLGQEIGDNALALQYYLIAEKNLEQARALAG